MDKQVMYFMLAFWPDRLVC